MYMCMYMHCKQKRNIYIYIGLRLAAGRLGAGRGSLRRPVPAGPTCLINNIIMCHY